MWGGYRYKLCYASLLFLVFFSSATSGAISCCSLANGSCKSTCEQISLVSVATNPEELQSKLQKLNDLCHKTQLFSFWECLNETLTKVNKGNGWIGRPCCHIPQSEKCKMACLQTKTAQDLQDSCRKSDEIPFFACVERQESGERCCRNAQTTSCRDACRKVFANSFTPSKEVRDDVNKYCSQDSPRIQQCIRNYTQVTPADHSFRNMFCCAKSLSTQCRNTCKEALTKETTYEETIDALARGGCGNPLPEDSLWQCFLMHSGGNTEPGGSLIQSEEVGLDSAKLQCCFRATTVNCQRLCTETFSDRTRLPKSWNDFERLCQYHLGESDMIRCLAEVDEPCELGCEGLNYCTNFNFRPTELFRKCDVLADQAALMDFTSWKEGTIHLPMMNIPVLEISECHPDVWKAIACALQIKPCHKEAHANMICKSDCINILNKCVDRSRLKHGENALTLCEILSPVGSDTPCISLSPYLVESNLAKKTKEVTHPCKPNPCDAMHVCIVNRNCLYGQPCVPYVCVPGCKMGHMSQLVVPINSHVRVPSNAYGPRCHRVCYCNHESLLEDCVSTLCPNDESCLYEGKRYNHNTKFTIGCNTCFCYDGEVTCSQKHCGTGLPCSCPDHYVPVCGANGKTYPSVCLARCAGLTDDQFEFGACYDSDPCSPNSCHPYDRCVPRKRVCLSIKHRSCKQYDCVNTQQDCNEQPKSPVCDTDNIEYPNICWMMMRKKTLAYYGKCMPHCRANGPVCGHNGETYASECAAWAERVSVDYKGACTAVGSAHGTESRCSSIKCSPLPSEHCTKVFPPGGCCPICGAAITLLYSQKLSDWSVEAVRDVKPVVVQTIAEELREHVKVTECEVFAYLSLESDIVVLFTAITDSPTDLQVAACIKEAEKVQSLIQQHSPTLLTELPLSFIMTSRMIDPVASSNICATNVYLALTLILLNLLLQRVL